MKPFAPFFGLPLGISSTFWFIMGLLRYITERISLYRNRGKKVPDKYVSNQIAAIIPAHNEELAIRKCVAALKQSLRVDQIHVVSDGSTDATADEARKENVRVSQTPGVGKAKAIMHAITTYKLFNKNALIFIVDADTRIDKLFIKRALPLFNDSEIGVVYGTARISWPDHIVPKLRFYYVAYRERLNRMLQYFFAYGQTWKYTNTTYVIPGFCTLWRSNILKKIPIDTPGLLIEDFNTAFYIHKHKVCKIGYNPDCIGWDQHPETLSDYWQQVRRWNIGFFQTVKLNGIWPSWYWLTLGIFTIEVFLNSIFILCLPMLIFFLLFKDSPVLFPAISGYVEFYKLLGPFQNVRLLDIFMSLYVFDYGLTVVIGLVHRKPQFIFYGLFFFIMHYVTSLILITSLIPGFFSKSAGRWTSPKRSLEQMSVKM
ncbi:MAG: glycosyltransferase family 2 protein [Patescibacteria group bacterium]